MAVVLEIQVESLTPVAGAEDQRTATFASFYARYHTPLVEYCRWALKGAGDAEEIAQEALATAWAQWDRYSPARPFWPWLTTLARRLCINQVRRATRRTRRVHVHELIVAMPSSRPDEIVERADESRAALLALRSLSRRDQRLITLRDLHDWSYQDIARYEDVTVESVRASLRRARQALRVSYDRVAGGLAAVVAPAAWGRRLVRWANRAQHAVAAAAPTASRLSEMVGVTVLSIALGATSFTAKAHSSSRHVTTIAARAVAATSPPVMSRDSEHARAANATRGLAPTKIRHTVAGAPATTPDDAWFESFTPSPAHDDHTVYASGWARSGCASVSCPVLFVSRDGGASWARLPAQGFVGGRVMLPPRFPADNRIFAVNDSALQQSNDGGRTFVSITPIGGPAAMSPSFSDGDDRILLGTEPGWEYHASTQALTPMTVVLAPLSVKRSFAFAPDYPVDSRIFIGGTSPDSSDVQTTAIFVCEGTRCAQPALLSGSVGGAQVAVSPDLATSGAVYAWTAHSLFGSRDGGATFRPVTLPTVGVIRTIVARPNGEVLAAITADGTPNQPSGLFVSANGGATWRSLGTSPSLRSDVVSVGVLADGRLLAGPGAAAGGGVLCSADRGVTWSRGCPL